MLKGIFNRLKGLRTVDLMLNNVRVVDNFYINIISSAQLKQISIQAIGYNRTLRFSIPKSNFILFYLIKEGNLAFIKYSIRSYPLPIIVKAIASRLDSKQLQH